MNARWLLVVLVLIAGVALAGKWQRYSAPPPDIQGQTEQILHSFLSVHGYTLVGYTPLTVRQTYRALTYEHLACQGQVHLIPLSDNAEGANLLKVLDTKEPVEWFFVYGGEIYKNYPDREYWLDQAWTALKRSLWIKSRSRLPVVVAAAETGTCPVIHPLNWDAL